MICGCTGPKSTRTPTTPGGGDAWDTCKNSQNPGNCAGLKLKTGGAIPAPPPITNKTSILTNQSFDTVMWWLNNKSDAEIASELSNTSASFNEVSALLASFTPTERDQFWAELSYTRQNAIFSYMSQSEKEIWLSYIIGLGETGLYYPA
jgi:hypothetical protein